MMMRWLDELRQDLRYALRTLGRSPGFAAVAIATLALGIGANTAIFSVVNAVLLRPLPYRDPGTLVLIEPAPLGLSPDWLLAAWRARAQSVGDFAGFNGPRAGTLVAGGEPEQVDSAEVTGNFFSFLGTPPVLGRNFTDADAAAGAVSVVILSHESWVRRFAGDRAILGSTITLNGESATVVGVAGPAFRFPTAGALPASALRVDTQPDVIRVAGAGRPLNVIGRLASEATPGAAGTELLGIFKQDGASRFRPAFFDRAQVEVAPLQERLVGNVRQRLWLVMGAVGFVLLVACANVANLLLARTTSRQRELAVRSALGARKSRLARLLLTESLLLALAGSAGALLLTYWLRGMSRAVLVDQTPHVAAIGIDWWVLGFNVVIAAITGILCGLAALPGGTNMHLGPLLSAGHAPGVTGRTLARRVLLATEVALTFVLVVGAALLAQTVWHLHRTDRGFDAERLLTVRVSPGLPPGLDRSQANAGKTYFAGFFSDLTDRIGRVPGVTSIAAVSSVPLGGATVGLSSFAIEGQAPVPVERGTVAANVSAVTPGYFRTMGTRIVAGRDFDAGDRMGAPTVAIVNGAFRRRFAPGREIVGARVTSDDRALTIVGLVEDVPDRSLREAARPLMFTPLEQMAAGPFGWGQLTLVVRTGGDSRALAALVQREIWAVNPNAVVDEVASMDERVAASVRTERQSALLFGSFALTALLIAAIGVYGVATYAMAQRTREIGIRMALGAARRDVIGLVVSQTSGPTLCGIAAGLAGAFAVTRVLGARLYGVSALDPASFAAAALVLASVAFAASYLPARRAMTIDPLAALRSE